MRRSMLIAAAAAVSLAAAPALAGANAYLQFESNGGQVEGTVTAAGFENTIRVHDAQFEIGAAETAPAGVARSKIEYKPVYVTLPVDKSTPLITQALAQNHSISNFRIDLTKPGQGGGEVVFYTIEISNGRVSSIVFDSVSPGNDRVKVGFSYHTMTQTDLQSGQTVIVSGLGAR